MCNPRYPLHGPRSIVYYYRAVVGTFLVVAAVLPLTSIWIFSMWTWFCSINCCYACRFCRTWFVSIRYDLYRYDHFFIYILPYCSWSKSTDFVNIRNDLRCFVIRSCLLAGQFSDFRTLCLRIAVCWSKMHWLSKWFIVWSPSLQGHAAFCCLESMEISPLVSVVLTIMFRRSRCPHLLHPPSCSHPQVHHTNLVLLCE